MKNRSKVLISVIMMCVILFTVFAFSDDKDLQKEVVEQITDTVTDMATYEMTEDEVKELPSTEIKEQTAEEEQKVSEEQEIEEEGFRLQGEIAYEGDRANTWDVELGDYKALTYYNQTDERWRFENV